jgi:hypothetical protein
VTLKLDATQLSVVATCTDCPWWRGFGFHPGQDQARKALRMAQERTEAALTA